MGTPLLGSRVVSPLDGPYDITLRSHLTNQLFLIYDTRVTTSTRAAADLDRAVALFHALSDETRLEIVEMLRDGERCVCELQDELDAAQSRLSFHLKVLKDAGLVTDRSEGRWSYYALVAEALAEVHDLAVAMQPSNAALRVLQLGSCCD